MPAAAGGEGGAESGGSAGYLRPAVTDGNFIELVQNSEDFASYHAFAQFAGDVFTYDDTDGYSIGHDVSIYSIDRNFRITFGWKSGLITTYWQGEKGMELRPGDTWTGGGYSAFDYMGIIGTPEDIAALKSANALRITGPEMVTTRDEILSFVSDLGEYTTTKANILKVDGAKYQVMDIEDRNLAGMSIYFDKIDDPDVGSPTTMFANSLFVMADKEGTVMSGLFQYHEATDGPMVQGWSEPERFHEGGIYFVTVFLTEPNPGYIMYIDEIYDGAGNWKEGGHYTFKLDTRVSHTTRAFDNTGGTSPIFYEDSTYIAEDAVKFDLKDLAEVRPTIRENFITWLMDNSSLEDFQARSVFAGDTLTLSDLGWDIQKPVWIYSIDRNFNIMFFPDHKVSLF